MTAAYNSTVNVTVEIAFGDGVFDTTPTWVDVTADVREFSTGLGRSRVLDQMQAGTATVALNNNTGDYNPENTAGANYPGVGVMNPIRILAAYNAVTYPLFRGFVETYDQAAANSGKLQVAVARCVDAFRLFAMFEEELTEVGTFSGTRLGQLLDTVGWPAGWRDMDTGNQVVSGLTGEFDSVLAQVHRTILVEQGLFWVAGDGDATFRDGHTRIVDKTSVVATFSDDGADLPYVDLQLAYDDSQLWNKAVVTSVGGTSQTVSDSTSITLYGQRDLNLSETIHYYGDGPAYSLAGWLVMENKDVRVRAPALVVKPEASPAGLWPVALGIDLLDRVNVERTQVGGDAFDEDCHVEGVAHEVRMAGGRSWTTTFQLSPVLPFADFWILGTSQLGTDTRLGY